MKNILRNTNNGTLLSEGWLALIMLFLFSGIIGHDPWKQDETYSFGIIYHFYTAHSWLIPMNVNIPFMEKPPLYYWSAVLMCKLLGGILSLPDAARMTSFVYMLATAWFAWKISQVLFQHDALRKEKGWMVMTLLLGSIGLVRHAHDMFTDVALLTGTAVAVYGMALLICLPDTWKQAGLWFGLGIGMAFMSKGLMMPVTLCASGIILWCALPVLHTRRTAWAVLISLCAAAPFLFIWPALLYQDSPLLFMQWFWDNNIGRFLGFSVHHLGAPNERYYFLIAVLWFAFPVFPLACITIFRDSRAWRKPEFALPFAIVMTGFALLLASASARALYLLPLLLPLSLLAVQALTRLPPRFLAGWNRAIRILFTALVIAIWLTWWGLLHPVVINMYPVLPHYIGKWLPLDFMPSGSQGWALMLAIALTAVWLDCLRAQPRSALGTAHIWLAGVMVLWGVSHTLLLPWINETKSYRSVIEQMTDFADRSPYAGQCMGNNNLGESIAPMFKFFGGKYSVSPTQDFSDTTCPMLFTVREKTAPELLDAKWKLVWKGSRALDEKNEELRLYVRKDSYNL